MYANVATLGTNQALHRFPRASHLLLAAGRGVEDLRLLDFLRSGPSGTPTRALGKGNHAVACAQPLTVYLLMSQRSCTTSVAPLCTVAGTVARPFPRLGHEGIRLPTRFGRAPWDSYRAMGKGRRVHCCAQERNRYALSFSAQPCGSAGSVRGAEGHHDGVPNPVIPVHQAVYGACTRARTSSMTVALLVQSAAPLGLRRAA
jgi:hypothetical protein